MARSSRTRTRPVVCAGSVSSQPLPAGPVTVNQYSLSDTAVCSDRYGRPVTAGPFSSTQYTNELTVSGTCESLYLSGSRYNFKHYPVRRVVFLNKDPIPAPSDWVLRLVSATNPSRPEVTPLTLIQDLVELPRMIWDLGRLLTDWHRGIRHLNGADAANQYLALQFGWLPLIRDIQSLMDMQALTMKRVRELNALYRSKRGLRKRIKFDSQTQVESTTRTYGLAGDAQVVFTMSNTVKKSSWATCNWKPKTSIFNLGTAPNDKQIYDQAYRVVRGLSVEGCLKGAWDIIPWTWLLGWFSSIGRYALANSNTVPASHGTCCYMCEISVVTTLSNIALSGSDSGKNELHADGTFVERRKTRSVSSNVVPGFNMPFLDMFRLSILTGLFVQRAKLKYVKN